MKTISPRQNKTKKSPAMIFAGALIAASPAILAQGINPLTGSKSINIIETINIYGQCGSKAIAIIGATHYNPGTGNTKFDWSGKPDVLIRRNGKETSLSDSISDHNTILCLENQKGNFLIIGSGCGGASCSEELSYTVIDIELNTTFPPKGANIHCSEQCANSLTTPP